MIDLCFREEVVRLRKLGLAVTEIQARLGVTKAVDRQEISAICQEKGMRPYGHGLEVSGPVIRRSGNYWTA